MKSFGKLAYSQLEFFKTYIKCIITLHFIVIYDLFLIIFSDKDTPFRCSLKVFVKSMSRFSDLSS